MVIVKTRACQNIFHYCPVLVCRTRHIIRVFVWFTPSGKKCRKKVFLRNFFYSRRKLRKKLEALRKKQFSSSGVWDVLYLTLHPNRFVYDGIFFSKFWTFYYLVPWARTFVTSGPWTANNCCFVNYFFKINTATCICIQKIAYIYAALPLFECE